MKHGITLKDVTSRNWQAVVALKLTSDQRDLVASNAYSLAQSKFDPQARPRAIYAGRKIVGFLMYDVDVAGKSREVEIYRFMIDREHQGKGYGRAALAAALAEIATIRGVRTVSICYMAGNRSAKQLYAGFGFREIGRDRDGEIVAELKL